MQKEHDGFVYWGRSFGVVLFWVYAVIVGLGAGLLIGFGEFVLGGAAILAILVVRLFVEQVRATLDMRDVLVEIRDQAALEMKKAKAPDARRDTTKATSPAGGEMRLG